MIGYKQSIENWKELRGYLDRQTATKMDRKYTKPELKQIIALQLEKLKATEELVRILRKQNKRIAGVNKQLIKELHGFAMKYGGE